MTERDSRERDILVASNEYAYVQDLTKGDIVLYVGPTKISLSNTERLVDFRDGRFTPVRADDGGGVHAFVVASSSEYIVLENPPKDPTARAIKGNNSATELLVGRKVVVPGPATFPLWPGQRATVVAAHELCEDEYLVVRIYDAVPGDARPIGTDFIVRGSESSRYAPTTGLEVVPDEEGHYVRKAHRLRRGMGLHLRVIAAFLATATDQVPAGAYSAGQDVFLEGREGFFFPTENLEVVGEIHAVFLAEHEGLYARDLATGTITTIKGPTSYLPDPTRVELVYRVLSAEAIQLYRLGEARPDRAPSIHVPSGFAVLVTARNRREVVRGPDTRVLDWGEELEVLELSTGTPKSSAMRLRTCFLQVDGNKVSDTLRLETADHNAVEATLSYRVSFRGEPERWFLVKDYVGLLCDHAGSRLRAAARATSVEAFHADSTDILRRALLGEKSPGEPRAGRAFEENGMCVYDLEVLEVRIIDAEVRDLLCSAQRDAIMAEVYRRQESLRLDTERLKQEVTRALHVAEADTLVVALELEARRRGLALAHAEAEAAVGLVASDARLALQEREATLTQKALEGRVAAFKEQMAALHPELVATLKMLGNQALTSELSKNASPLAVLGGESVTDVVERLLGSLPIGVSGTVAKALPVKART